MGRKLIETEPMDEANKQSGPNRRNVAETPYTLS
jgi:hypothetical protein